MTNLSEKLDDTKGRGNARDPVAGQWRALGDRGACGCRWAGVRVGGEVYAVVGGLAAMRLSLSNLNAFPAIT